MKQKNRGLQLRRWILRELVIKRLQECSFDSKVIVDSNEEEHVVSELDLMSDEDLLALFEDLIGFNG